MTGYQWKRIKEGEKGLSKVKHNKIILIICFEFEGIHIYFHMWICGQRWSLCCNANHYPQANACHWWNFWPGMDEPALVPTREPMKSDAQLELLGHNNYTDRRTQFLLYWFDPSRPTLQLCRRSRNKHRQYASTVPWPGPGKVVLCQSLYSARR